MPHSLRHAAVTLVVGALLLTGCARSTQPEPSAEGGPLVLVTTPILGDIVSTVLADTAARVETLMPDGADPHTYAPSAGDARRVAEADLVLANGLGLEVALDDVLATAQVLVELAEAVDPRELDPELDGDLDGDHDEDDDEDGHEGETAEEHAAHAHEGLDPHVWLDPVRVGRLAVEAAAAYADVAVDERDAAAAIAAASAYADEMDALAVELQQLVDTVPEAQRVLVSNHDALGYLADRFGFEVVATVLPGSSTDAELSAAGMRELVATLDEQGVRVVFTEATGSDRVARSLAEELEDIVLVELFTGALGPAGSGADTVPGMLRTDVERIVDALA